MKKSRKIRNYSVAKKTFVTILSMMMVLTSIVPAFAVEDVRIPSLTVKPIAENEYYILQIAVPSSDVKKTEDQQVPADSTEPSAEIYEWGSGITTDKKLLEELGDPADFISTLEDINKTDKPDKLIKDLVSEYDKYLEKDNVIEPVKTDENKFEIPEGLYLIADEKEFYQPQFLWFEGKDLKTELSELPKEESKDIAKNKSSSDTKEDSVSEDEGKDKDTADKTDRKTDGEYVSKTDKADQEQGEKPAEKAEKKTEEPDQQQADTGKSVKSRKASGAKSADNEWIERFTATFSRGAEDVSDQLVWTPTNANADHRFVYRINYAFSGEFELPVNSVEIRIPKKILKNRFGEYDDYYDIAIPLEEEADEDTKFVYEEDGDELRIWNIQEISAGESGTIECSYLTKDKTFYYRDMEAHDPFYADIEVNNAGQSVTAHADAPPVHINTNSVIVSTDKRQPTLFYSWNNSWGASPDNADDYLYIRWEVRTKLNKNNTQPYDFSLADTFDDGEVVGYKFEGQSTYSMNNVVPNVYQTSDERYDYVITRHSKADFAGHDYTVWNNITATVHPIDLLDPDTQATDREPFKYEVPTYHYPPGHFYADKFGQYTDTYTTGFDPQNYGIVQDSEDISDYDLEAFVENETDKLNDPHLKYYTYVRGYPYPWTLPQGATGDDPSQYGTRPVKYELWDETIDIEDNDPLVGGEDYEFSQLHFIFDFNKATFNENTLEFDTSAATVSDFTAANNVIFYAKKAGDTDYVKIGEFAPGTKTWSDVNSAYVQRTGLNDVYFKSDVIGYKLETSNALWYTCLRAYPHLTLFRNEKTLSQIGDASKVRIDNTSHILITDADGKELFPGDAENSRGGLFKDGMVNSDYVMKIQRQSNIEKYVSGTRNNKAKKTFTVTWRINMEESYTDNAGRHQIEQSSGKFYDLCPIGSHPDKSSVIVYDNGTVIDPSYYTVSVKPNYKDSGRDLLIVDIKKPGTKYSMYYDTIHEWEDLSQVEFKIFNSVAYQTGNKKIAEGYPDNGGNGKDKAVLNDLDPDNDDVRFIYSQDWHDVDLVVATSTGINKKVRAEEDAKYSYSTMTYVDGNYSYRWRVANDEVTKLKDMILFDSMENFTKNSENIESDWHGYVQSVDTAMLREQGIFPVVYYSSLENMDIYSHHDLNETINGERVWKVKSEFGDISNAKAIAIDCSKTLDGEDFILENGESLETFVNMKAPSQGMNLGRVPYAYNNIFLSSTKIDPLGQEHPDLIHQDYTKIGYKIRGDIDFYKVDKKNHDTKIEGITFRLYGRSDYGTDIDVEATSTADGHVQFRNIEQGTYELRELGGSVDWQVDREIKHVTIDEDGKATIDGLSKDGIINRYYVWENETRIHADVEFTKRSHQRNEEAKAAIDAIKAITPGSADTVTVDGKEFFVLVNENDTRALLLGKNSIGTGNYSMILPSFEWESSKGRETLSTYLTDKNVLDDLALQTAVTTHNHVTDDEIATADEVFILTEADYFGTVKGGSESASNNDYTYGERPLVTSVIIDALKTSGSSNYIAFRDSAVDASRVAYLSSRRMTISTGSGIGPYHVLPAMWVSITDVPDRTIPDTKFVLSGTSDYGNEIYETGTTSSNGKLTLSNIEQGAYTLIETEANEDYIPNTGKQWTVIVDKNGLVNILDDGKTIEQKNSNYIVRNIPRYHNFDIRKVDAMSGEWLEGATFHLYGTSNLGTATDMTVTTGSNGKAEFLDVEAGTYLIKETAAPDRHLIDPKTRVVTIDDFGTVIIEGLNPNEYGEIEWNNERALEGKIVITKVWKDNKTDAERPVPKVTISTKKPLFYGEAYAVFDSSDGSLTFFRDEKGKYTNNQRIGTKTFYTGIETSHYESASSVPWYSNRTAILSVACEDAIRPISTSRWFYGCYKMSSCDLKKLNTSKTTDMSWMFSVDQTIGNVVYDNSALTTLDISHFDTSNVTNMSGMFYFCNNLTELDLSHFDTSNVTNMSYMFQRCRSLTNLDFSSFDTSNVTNMRNMFDTCNELTSLDLSSFDTSNVTDMRYMFSDCNKLTSLDLSSFDTSNVTNMYYMFERCTTLTSLDLSNFDTSNVTDMRYMFANCHKLRSLDLSSFDTNNVTNMSDMFSFTRDIKRLALGTKSIFTISLDYDYPIARCETLNGIPEEGPEYTLLSQYDGTAPGWYNVGTGVFAIYDSDDKSLTFVNLGKYTSHYNGETVGTKTYYSGFESSGSQRWSDKKQDIEKVFCQDPISARNCAYWFEDCTALTEVNLNNLDTSNVKNFSRMFYNCRALTSLDLSNFDTSNATAMARMFYNCRSLRSLDISSFDTSKVTDMNFMFYYCRYLTSLDLSGWNTNKVTDMTYMFSDCSAMANIYASELWNTNAVTSSSAMFYRCTNLPNFNSSVTDKTNAHYNTGGYLTYKAAPTANTDNSSANNISTASTRSSNRSSSSNLFVKLGLVQEVYAAEGDIASGTYRNVDWRITAEGELQIGKEGQTQEYEYSAGSHTYPWEAYSDQILTGRVVGLVKGNGNMDSMFEECTKMTSLDLSNFDTTNVNRMVNMFYDCNALTSLDLSGWDTGNVTNMYRMFYGCKALTNLDVSGWDTGNVTSMSSMFSGCNALTSLDVSAWDTGNVTSMYQMFNSCKALTSLDVSGWDTGNVTNMGSMFYGCKALTSLDVSGWDTGDVTNMQSMFSGCNGLINLDVSGWDTGRVTNMSYMFNDCSSLTNLDLSSFDTSSVTDMSYMFERCSALANLNVSGFDTSSVTSMHYMLYECRSLTSIDLDNWDTSNVTDMVNMFYGCKALTTLDVSGFDTSSVTSMELMFYGCKALTTLDLSTFDTSNVTDMHWMFDGCNSLTSLDLSGWDTSNVTNMIRMFSECSALTNLDLSGFNTSSVTSMNSMFSGCNGLKKLVLGENFVIPASNNNLVLSGKWQRVATESGRKVKAGPLLTSAELAASYNGATDHGIYLKEGTDPSEYGIDLSETYTTLDENWVKNGDGTWTYTFDVYDDEVPFYGFEDLIEGYDVEFDEDNQFVINEDGTITRSATITNTSNETGSLHITKTVTGNYTSADRNREFEFKVTMSNENTSLFEGTKEYGDIIYKDGVTIFKLKHGQSIDLTGLPLNTTYLVEETPVAKFATNITNASGVLTDATAVNVTANNAKESTPTQNLVVTKKLSGVISADEEFTFKAVLKELDPDVTYSLNNSSANTSTTFKADSLGNAAVTFKLRGSGTATFYSLPVGSTYVITEEGNAYTPSYEITESSGTGTIVNALDSENKGSSLSTARETIDTGETATVSFTNTNERKDDGTLDLNLLKKDSETNEPLGDATFNLSGTSVNGEEVDINLISDSSGKIKFKKLETGTYTLKETKSPAGYKKNGRTYTVHINTEGSPQITQQTKISKTPNIDEDGTKLSDHVSSTDYTDSITIPGAEELTVELTYSNFRGYLGVWAGAYDTRATNNFGDPDQLHLDNGTGASPSISYVNGQDHMLLHKTFTVEGDSVTFLHNSYAYNSSTSGYNENTNYGYYAVVTGTVKSEESVIVEGLTPENGEYVVYNTPIPTGDFSFKKIDTGNGSSLEGARFSLSDGNTVVDRKASDKNGIVSFEGLDFGKEYTLREIEAPDGYLINEEEFAVTLTQGGPIPLDETKVSHTPNVSDTGYQNASYSHNMSTNDVITIPGAERLKVELYYNGESISYDWLSVWKGNYPSYTAYNNKTSTGYVTTADGAPDNANKFGGYQSDTYTVNGNTLTSMGHTTLEFEGDTVTFGFRSDSSGVGQGYGYYAVVTGYRTSEDEVTIVNGSGEELDKDGGIYIIDNTRKPVEFTLKKTVRGADGDKTKKFDFSYVLTDAAPDTNYEAHTGDTYTQISTDSSGAATGTLQLADTETFIIEDLPEGAKIIITETANDHKAEYRAVIGKDSASGGNPSENIALTTDQITIADGATVVFTNTKDEIIPLPTGLAKHGLFAFMALLALGAGVIVFRRKTIIKK